MTAHEMRLLARETVFSCGGRGFVRFADSGEALLVCDAVRRCSEDEAKKIALALEERGFTVFVRDNLLLISPGDAMLGKIVVPDAVDIRWDGSCFRAQALAARLLRAPQLPLTDDGRALAIEALRLTGRPGKDVLSGLGVLRAQAAVMLRKGDHSGMRIAGGILAAWCIEQIEEEMV